MRFFIGLLAAQLFLVAFSAVRADEPPAAGRLVSLEVVLADVAGAAADGDISAAKILELEKQGKLDSVTRLRLSALEQQLASTQFGETVPVVTGRMARGGFGGEGGTASYNMQNVGTQVQTTTRVEQDGNILVELTVERTRLAPPKPAAEGEAQPSVEPRRMSQVNTKTTVRVASGKPVLVGGQQLTAGKDSVHTYIVLTATLPEGKVAAAPPPALDQLRILTLKNAKAADLLSVLTAVFGRRMTIGVDERSNSLVVNSTPEQLAILEAIVQRLDDR